MRVHAKKPLLTGILLGGPAALFLVWQLTTTLVSAGINQLTALIPQAQAERLESNSYIIQFGNFNVGSGEGESSQYGLTYTIGQTAPGPFGQYGSSNYFIGSGFQYIYQIQTFGFAVDTVAVNLGELHVGEHNTAENRLTITTRGAGGYTIYAFEEHPLQHTNGVDEIPDTICDGSGCDETIAGVWTNPAVPGFGFSVTADDAAADFLNTTYFRQFADDSIGEEMQSIMHNDNVVTNETGDITYKAGIAGTQTAGRYQTGIVYVAVPGY